MRTILPPHRISDAPSSGIDPFGDDFLSERWSPGQRNAHRKVQRRKARALSSAQNRALGLIPAKEDPSNLIHGLRRVRPDGRGSVMEAMACNSNRADGTRSPVRKGGEVHSELVT